MIRTKLKEPKRQNVLSLNGLGKADGIFSGDWHLTLNTPIGRKDDYQKAMWDKVAFIKALQEEHDCGVYLAGDVFDHWKPSPYLIAKVAENIPANTNVCYGNHDLPQHVYEQRQFSGLYALEATKVLKTVPFGFWRDEPEKEDGFVVKGKRVFIWHKCVYQVKEPWMDSVDGASHALRLLKKYPQFDLIVTGDNHKPFIEEYKGRLLVNCGSLMRMNTKQINYKPCVYLWYAKTNTIVPVPLPIKKDVFSTEHIEKVKERDSRISEFAQSFSKWEGGLDFAENLQAFERSSKPDKDVMSLVYKATDYEQSLI